MAYPLRGLALVLTIGMVAWLAAPIRTSPMGSGWWGTQEALELRQTASRFASKSEYAETERVYRHGAELAAQHRDTPALAWFTAGIGDARFASFDYRGALKTYLQGRAYAEKARDPKALGAIDGNLASLYQQMGDSDSAMRAAEESRSITQRLGRIYYRSQLLVLLARLRADQSTVPLLREAIETARNSSPGDSTQASIEAIAWQYLGAALLERGDLAGANAAAENALQIRQEKFPGDLGESYWGLGTLRLKEAERSQEGTRQRLLSEARDFTERAIRSSSGVPTHLIEYQLGQILLAQGSTREGLEKMLRAIQQAQVWRSDVVPAVAFTDSAAGAQKVAIFDGFIKAAANYGIQAHDQRWVEESFEANELNRAINLSDSARYRLRERLPVEYWEVLGKLQAEEIRLQQGASAATSSECDRLKLKLTELEAGVGLGSSPNIAENFPSDTSLNHFQAGLKDSEMLLSFALGERDWFIWAVTRDTLTVYRLPPAERIVGAVREFRRLVEGAGSGSADGKWGFEDLGGQLYEMLFGQLTSREASKPEWLLSAEDALLELPFGALVLEPRTGSEHTVFLAERHSLEIKAGALLPARPPEHARAGIVLVGDPIYNIADPRWGDRGTASTAAKIESWFSKTWISKYESNWTGRVPDNQLNRLPGSHTEIAATAGVWGGEPTVVLEGASASRDKFLRALKPAPRVIHLATHALTLGSRDEGYLAFSLGGDGRPELLSTFEVRTLDVSGSLVVMTGCATAPNDVRAGLGLAGLVRAWTVAGASAVVATEWPVQDSTGSLLLTSFYKYLRADPTAAVAEALRTAQIEMIHSGTNEAAPAVWAAYQVFRGNAGSADLQ